ncbi:unnamed protein product, partial [Discosporangium mesarthrocarpum]
TVSQKDPGVPRGHHQEACQQEVQEGRGGASAGGEEINKPASASTAGSGTGAALGEICPMGEGKAKEGGLRTKIPDLKPRPQHQSFNSSGKPIHNMPGEEMGGPRAGAGAGAGAGVVGLREGRVKKSRIRALVRRHSSSVTDRASLASKKQQRKPSKSLSPMAPQPRARSRSNPQPLGRRRRSSAAGGEDWGRHQGEDGGCGHKANKRNPGEGFQITQGVNRGSVDPAQEEEAAEARGRGSEGRNSEPGQGEKREEHILMVGMMREEMSKERGGGEREDKDQGQGMGQSPGLGRGAVGEEVKERDSCGTSSEAVTTDKRGRLVTGESPAEGVSKPS